MTSSLISIIIPVFNRPQLLEEALASISVQKYRHFEVIVIDDGSTEPIGQVVETFQTKNDILVHFIRQGNAGPGAARNRGLDVAKGDFIAFLDSDDLWYPEMLQTTIKVLESNLQADMACGGWDMIDESGKAITGVFQPSGLQPLVDGDFAEALIFKNRFPIHSVLTRKKCFQMYGIFDPELIAFEDWELWIRMAAQGCRIVFFDVPVARWRCHHDLQRSPSGSGFPYAARQVIERLFSNMFVADRYIKYRSAAEILLWLQQANSYSQRGLVRDAAECIQYAERCLEVGPFEEDVFRAFIESSLSVPQARNFRRILAKLMDPSLRRKIESEIRWRQVIADRRDRRIEALIKELLGLVYFNPSWFFRKILRALSVRLKISDLFRIGLC